MRKRFLKNKNQENRMLYIQQENYCVSLLKKTKIRYYTNLNEKEIYIKNRLEVVKSLVLDKSISENKLIVTESVEHVKTETKTAKVLYRFSQI